MCYNLSYSKHAKEEINELSRYIKKENDRIVASVAPEKVDLVDPLASIDGAVNAITYECDLLGPVTLSGAGAGKKETGFSLLIDQKKTTQFLFPLYPICCLHPLHPIIDPACARA